MKQVAKLLIVDNDDTYLLLYRSDHPTFGNDPDLPGGTVEEGEEPVDAMVREVYEEAGIEIAASDAEKVYQGLEYSTHHTEYSLYQARLAKKPEVVLSWEHSSYEWLTRDDFLKRIERTEDTYMRMVYEKIAPIVS